MSLRHVCASSRRQHTAGAAALSYGTMVKQWLLGMLAAAIVVATVALVATVAGGADLLQQVRGRQPVTLAAAVLLFGMVVIVVGAGAAVRYLIDRMKRVRARRP